MGYKSQEDHLKDCHQAELQRKDHLRKQEVKKQLTITESLFRDNTFLDATEFIPDDDNDSQGGVESDDEEMELARQICVEENNIGANGAKQDETLLLDGSQLVSDDPMAKEESQQIPDGPGVGQDGSQLLVNDDPVGEQDGSQLVNDDPVGEQDGSQLVNDDPVGEQDGSQLVNDGPQRVNDDPVDEQDRSQSGNGEHVGEYDIGKVKFVKRYCAADPIMDVELKASGFQTDSSIEKEDGTELSSQRSKSSDVISSLSPSQATSEAGQSFVNVQSTRDVSLEHVASETRASGVDSTESKHEKPKEPRDRAEGWKAMLLKEAEKLKKKKRMSKKTVAGMVEEEAEEEEEEIAAAGLEDFGFGVINKKKDKEEEAEEAFLESGKVDDIDLEGIVDELSDDEGDEEAGAKGCRARYRRNHKFQ